MPDRAIIVADPWKPFGLNDDPFFQQPLEPTVDTSSRRPISLFVGRERDTSLLASQIVGSSSSRAIVQGLPGVGKTSFVNRLKTTLADHDVLTHVNPVRVIPGMSVRHFQGEVLRVLVGMHRSLDGERGIAATVKRAAKSEAALSQAERYWRRVGRISEGEDSMSASVSTPIGGMSRGRVRISAEVDGITLFDEVAEGFRHLSRSGRRIMIHVDNLENLSRDDAKAAGGLIQDLRDTFMADNSHWLYVGTTGIEEQIFRRSAQMDGIIPFTVTLGPLTPAEVAELLKRRYKHLQMGKLRARPIAGDVAATLYERYQGNLRDFLRLLSNAVQRYALAHPGTQLSAADVVAEMGPALREQKLTSKIGEVDTAYLEATVSGMPGNPAFRVTEVQERNQPMSQPAASKFIKRMLEAGVIAFRRREGQSVYYGLAHGDYSIALGLS